jgi:hypothetical protein
MKRTKFLAMCFNFFSMSALAAYQCELKLSHENDPKTILAARTVQVGNNKMESGNMGTLLMESETKRKRTSLDINAMMNGTKNEEDAAFVILRRTRKKNSASAQRISDVLLLQANQQASAWFESYKLDIECQVK